jgi:hypothetical protein
MTMGGGREREQDVNPMEIERLCVVFSLTADLSFVLVGILNVRNESGMREMCGECDECRMGLWSISCWS